MFPIHYEQYVKTMNVDTYAPCDNACSCSRTQTPPYPPHPNIGPRGGRVYIYRPIHTRVKNFFSPLITYVQFLIRRRLPLFAAVSHIFHTLAHPYMSIVPMSSTRIMVSKFVKLHEFLAGVCGGMRECTGMCGIPFLKKIFPLPPRLVPGFPRLIPGFAKGYEYNFSGDSQV